MPAAAGGLAVAVTLQPFMATAQEIPQPNFSAAQTYAVFVNAGYQVDQANTWSWLQPAIGAFQVHDVVRNRVLPWQVYPDFAQAQRCKARGQEWYSASTWFDNLAVSEANADGDRTALLFHAPSRSLVQRSIVAVTAGLLTCS